MSDNGAGLSRHVRHTPYTIGGGGGYPPPPLPPPPSTPDESDHRGKKRNLPLQRSGRAVLVHKLLGPRSPPSPPPSTISRPLFASQVFASQVPRLVPTQERGGRLAVQRLRPTASRVQPATMMHRWRGVDTSGAQRWALRMLWTCHFALEVLRSDPWGLLKGSCADSQPTVAFNPRSGPAPQSPHDQNPHRTMNLTFRSQAFLWFSFFNTRRL